MARTATNYAEIQQDEIEALRSIYMDDFGEGEVKAGAWNTVMTRHFKISLHASLRGESKLAVTFSVNLPPTYPKTLPTLDLSFHDDVPRRTRVQALEIIKNNPRALVGSEMIYEIASSLQEILDQVPNIDPRDIPSLEEERILREQIASTQLQEEQEEAVRKEGLDDSVGAEEEQRVLDQLVANEMERSTHRKHRKGSSAADEAFNRKDLGHVIQLDHSVKVRNQAGQDLEFGALFGKRKYRNGTLGSVWTVQPLVKTAEYERRSENEDHHDPPGEPDPFLALKEYSIRGSEDDAQKQAVKDLEDFLRHQTAKTTQHDHVVTPITYTIARSESQGWTIKVLIPLATKGSLSELLDVVETIKIKRVRTLSLHILDGLRAYHHSSGAHGGVHLDNILLQQGEAKLVLAMLSDGGYVHMIHKLVGKETEHVPVQWRAPEGYTGSASIKIDMWDFGTCLLQMAFGKEVLKQYRSVKALLSEMKLSSSFEAVIRAIFSKNVDRRPEAWELVNFEFFRNDEDFLQNSGGDQDVSTLLYPSNTASLRSRRQSNTMTASRYEKEFVEEGRLGRGGFGEVFKVRNRTDNQQYAIKKIKAQTKSALDTVLSEVSVLSRLNHPNVVRYYASWIEDLDSKPSASKSHFSDDSTLSSLRPQVRGLQTASFGGLDFISSNNDHAISDDEDDDEDPFGSDVHEDDDDNNVLFKNDSNDDEHECSRSGGFANANGDSIYGSDEEDEDHSFQPETHTAGLSSEQTEEDASVDPSGYSEQNPEQHMTAVLYIQMEYCTPRNLRHIIKMDGIQKESAEGYRLLRQILEGLVHIHAANIVHRDLKPENVFIDNKGDVRIGDFGLARPGEFQGRFSQGSGQVGNWGNFTQSVGTLFYIAPEVSSSGTGKYDQKADMFSLGIIFLEMNAVFGTESERRAALSLVQRKTDVLPDAMSAPEKQVQAALIRSMLQQDPKGRPSSLELLKSDQIPVQFADETLASAKRLMMDPKSQLRQTFLASFFEEQASSASVQQANTPEKVVAQKLSLLDDAVAMSRQSPQDMELQTLVKRKLTAIYRKHGAVERTNNPVLTPFHEYYAAQDVYLVVHQSGKMMQLPYDLVLPNAMLLARKGLTGPKRTFIFGNVYRGAGLNDRPGIFGETTFEISGVDADDLALHEAECIQTLDNVLDAFPNLASSPMCYHLNHSRLLDAVLKFSDIDQKVWPSVKGILSKLHTGVWTWAKLRHELRAPPLNVRSMSLDELERFDFHDTVQAGIAKAKTLLPSTKELDACFLHLDNVTSHLLRLNVKRKVMLNPLASVNEKFYRDSILFQCLFDQKKPKVFAAGGRYDQLVREHQPIATRNDQTHIVGFQMSWSGLANGLSKHLKILADSKSKKKNPDAEKTIVAWRSRRCDVVVDSFDPALIHTTGLDTLRDLWAANVSAELADVELGVPTEYTKKDESKEGYMWIVNVKTADLLKVKNTAKKEEVELRPADLVNHIRTEIRERERDEGRSAGVKSNLLQRFGSIPEGRNNEGDVPNQDVKVITPVKGGKKANRQTIVDDAKEHAQQWRNTAGGLPIVAIETKDTTFNAIDRIGFFSTEAWRKVIQDAPPAERSYLVDVLRLLESYASQHPAVYLYNSRTKQICFQRFAKS